MKVNKSYMYKGFDLKLEISRQILPQKHFLKMEKIFTNFSFEAIKSKGVEAPFYWVKSSAGNN